MGAYDFEDKVRQTAKTWYAIGDANGGY